MTKGLHVNIFKSHFGSCANGGISGKVDSVVLTGPGIAENVEPTAEAPEVELLPANIGPGFKAVPAKHGDGAGPMFGGCFIYSSDGRFPSTAPIALHDRWESAELNKALSR